MKKLNVHYDKLADLKSVFDGYRNDSEYPEASL